MTDPARVDRLNLRAAAGQETISFRLAPFAGRSGLVTVDIGPDSPLDVGYDSAIGRLDRQSLGRLLHWLQTGVALDRDDPRIPEPFTGIPPGRERLEELLRHWEHDRWPATWSAAARQLRDTLEDGTGDH